MKVRILAAALGAAALLPAAASAAVSPPAPTGPAPVGFTRLTMVDAQRTEQIAQGGGPRRIPLRVWYPAARPGSGQGDVLTAAEQGAYEAGFGLPAGAFAGLGATSTQHAPPAPGRHPVLLLSHGAGLSTAFHVAQATDLASHGHVVIGLDHLGDAELDEVGGDLVFSNPVGDDFRRRSFVERVADIRFVADHLGAVTGAGRFDRRRVGIYGHSLGGAAAAQAMAEDRRFRAGVNIDGAMLGSVIDRGLDRPFATLLGDFPWEVYDGLGAFLSHTRAPHPLERFATTGHQAFTDIVWLVPQLGADPAEFNLGTVGAGEAVRSQRCFLRRFFAHALS